MDYFELKAIKAQKTQKQTLTFTFSSVQFSRSVMSDSLQPHGLQQARLPCPSPLLEFARTNVHQVCDAIQPSHPLSSPSPPAFSLSQHQGQGQIFSSDDQSIGSFGFSISPFNEYSELISFRIDWFYLHTIQGTLKSLIQHHSSKASILCHLAFFIVQLSHSYVTTGNSHSFD